MTDTKPQSKLNPTAHSFTPGGFSSSASGQQGVGMSGMGGPGVSPMIPAPSFRGGPQGGGAMMGGGHMSSGSMMGPGRSYGGPQGPQGGSSFAPNAPSFQSQRQHGGLPFNGPNMGYGGGNGPHHMQGGGGMNMHHPQHPMSGGHFTSGAPMGTPHMHSNMSQQYPGGGPGPQGYGGHTMGGPMAQHGSSSVLSAPHMPQGGLHQHHAQHPAHNAPSHHQPHSMGPGPAPVVGGFSGGPMQHNPNMPPLHVHHAPQHHHHHNPNSGVHTAAPHIAVPDRALMKPAAAPPLPNAVIALSSAPLEGEKSTFCAALAETYKFRHIVLKDEFTAVQGKGSDEEEVSELSTSRLEMLESVLESAMGEDPQPAGFVIENVVGRCKHEIVWVDDILRRLKIRLHTVVLFDQSASSIPVLPDQAKDAAIAHPIGFEMCAAYFGDDHGSTFLYMINPNDPPAQSSPTTSNNSKQTPKSQSEPVFDVDVWLKDFARSRGDVATPKSEPPLPAPLVHPSDDLPCTGVTLEVNCALAFKVIRAAYSALAFHHTFGIFAPPYAAPGMLLDYATFTRQANALRQYLVTPTIDGEAVTIVGHQKHAYLLTGGTGMVYRFNDDANEALSKLLRKAATEDSSGSSNGVHFAFSAVLTPNPSKIVVTDLLYHQGTNGASLYHYERYAILKEAFAAEATTSSGSTTLSIVLRTYCDVEEIGNKLFKLQREEADQGLSFIHPGCLKYGDYDFANYLWFPAERKHMDVRLWGGQSKQVAGNMYWFFDALVIDGGEVKLADIPVVIPDSTVTDLFINDGNIVCVTLTEDAPNIASTAPQVRGKGATQKKDQAAQALPSPRLTFVKRRVWSIFPMAKLFTDIILQGPKSAQHWPRESLGRSVAFLHPPTERLRRQEEATNDESD